MKDFKFQRRVDREGNEELRDAWIASQEFSTRCMSVDVVAHCTLCQRQSTFHLQAKTEPADLRELLLCTACGLNTRIREGLRLALQSPDQRLDTVAKDIYITEQATRAYAWLQNNLRSASVWGSEFERSEDRRKNLATWLNDIGGNGEIAFQDVTRLTFEDGSRDVVISFDVLEHVPDYEAAISEFFRILRPGGALVATFPFTDGPRTLVRAKVAADGTVHHLEPPEYHGDPIGGGVLCFYHFGWDILDTVRKAGFSMASMVMPYSLDAATPYGMWTLFAER